MKLLINKPQNGYQGWTGIIVETSGKRHSVKMDCGAAFNTRAALVKAAQRKAAGIKHVNGVTARARQQMVAAQQIS